MLDLIAHAGWYYNWKAHDAKTRYAALWPKPVVPAGFGFNHPDELATWIYLNLRYTGDGPRFSWNQYLNRWIGIGFPDSYTHPNVLLEAVVNGTQDKVECDCDDYANFAERELRKMAAKGLPVTDIQQYVIVAGTPVWTWEFPFVYWPTHQICTFTYGNRVGVIDTNVGINGALWFQTMPDAIAWFENAYRTSYSAMPIGYAFDPDW